jgi:hypothetical protein
MRARWALSNSLPTGCAPTRFSTDQGTVKLHTDDPAPQPGDRDHYVTFLERICRFYDERFADIDSLPASVGLSLEEALRRIAAEDPGLLSRAGALVDAEGAPGAAALRALLASLDLHRPADETER